MYAIDTTRLRFGLQIFSDMDPEAAQSFWIKTLEVDNSQFQKVVVTKSSARGTYTKKTKHGVLTVYFSNTKLRDSIMSAIKVLQEDADANVAQSVERIHGKSQ